MSQAISPVGNVVKAANRRLAIRLLAVIAGSLLFVAFQPQLYKTFCEWAGIYDIGRADNFAASPLAGRPVRLEFDANSFDNGLRFHPEMATLSAQTGNVVHVTYRVENTRDTAIIGQAVPSYSPQHAGGYVRKLDCFCFKQQYFAPREVRELPVVFVLDPDLPAEVNTVTLSYTFFEVPEGSVQGSMARAKSTP